MHNPLQSPVLNLPPPHNIIWTGRTSFSGQCLHRPIPPCRSCKIHLRRLQLLLLSPHRPSPLGASAWGRLNYVVITACSPRAHHAAAPFGADWLLMFIPGRPMCSFLLIWPYWVYISLGSPLPSRSHIRFPTDDIFTSFLLLPPWSRRVLAIRCISPRLPHHDAQ